MVLSGSFELTERVCSPHPAVGPNNGGSMVVLGVRCSNTNYAYAVLTGTKAAPSLVDCALVGYPKGYSHPEVLKWLLQEIEALDAKHHFDGWTIKGAEPLAAKGNSHTQRVECEAIVTLAAANSGHDTVTRKTKPTIAKSLGLPGKAAALATLTSTPLIPEIASQPDKVFEAIVVAWSDLA